MGPGIQKQSGRFWSGRSPKQSSGGLHRLAVGDELGVWSVLEKRCVCVSGEWMITLRRQGHVAERGLGNSGLWLASGALSPEAVRKMGCACAEMATEVKGVCGELCVPWLKVLDLILWNPMSLGAEKRGIAGKTVIV